MEETEDPGVLTFVNDIKTILYGVWSLFHCFLTISYLSGKCLVEWVSWTGETIWESFCLSAEGLKALFNAIIELEESMIRAVVLVHYSIGQIFEAFEVTFYDLVNFIEHFQETQLNLLSSVAGGCVKALSTVLITVPQHICSALCIIGDFALECVCKCGYILQDFCLQLIYSPINVILFVSDLGIRAAALPGQVFAAVPFSAHVGSMVVLLVYVVYCKMSFFRAVKLLVSLLKRLYKTVKKVPHFLSQIRKLVPGLRRSVVENNDLGPNFADIKGICVICHDAAVSFLANPCNHLCLCEPCTHRIIDIDHLCPICRRPVDHYMKVYVS